MKWLLLSLELIVTKQHNCRPIQSWCSQREKSVMGSFDVPATFCSRSWKKTLMVSLNHKQSGCQTTGANPYIKRYIKAFPSLQYVLYGCWLGGHPLSVTFKMSQSDFFPTCEAGWCEGCTLWFVILYWFELISGQRKAGPVLLFALLGMRKW